MIARRKPLARSKPPQRKNRLKAKRSKPRRSARRLDPEYLALVRTLGCVTCSVWPTEASHVGPRGLGQKCSDDEAVPMCRPCHDHWHGCSGPFEGLTKQGRIEMASHMTTHTRRVLGRGVDA